MSSTDAKSEPKQKKKMGAPVKLTEKVHKDIINALMAGTYLETASAAAGVHRDSLFTWLKKGKQQKSGIYRDFSDAVEKALATAELRDVLVIDSAANGRKAEYLIDRDGNIVRNADGDPVLVKPATRPEWQAAAWRLERKFPKKWGRKDRLDIPEEPIEDSIDSMSPEDRERKVQEIIARRKARGVI